MPNKSNNKDWMSMLEEWFMKVPPLPKGGREAIVKITPWVALVFGVLGLLAGLAGLGILTALSPFVAVNGGYAGAGLITAVLGVASSALLLAAFPGTKANKMNGWKMLFYSEAVGVVSAVISISITGVLVSLIGFYILFQIKSYYK